MSKENKMTEEHILSILSVRSIDLFQALMLINPDKRRGYCNEVTYVIELIKDGASWEDIETLIQRSGAV